MGTMLKVVEVIQMPEEAIMGDPEQPGGQQTEIKPGKPGAIICDYDGCYLTAAHESAVVEDLINSTESLQALAKQERERVWHEQQAKMKKGLPTGLRKFFNDRKVNPEPA